MGILSSIASIADKLLKPQRRRDLDRLQKLEKLYATALNEGRDMDASIFRKEMEQLRITLENEGV